MFSFFNTYPEFSSQEQTVIIETLKEMVTRFGLDHEYTNIVFMTDDELLKINKEFLGHDYYTDIITFNYSDVPNQVEAELYISIDRVKENAAKNDVSMQDEMRRVIFHGMLHLAGYDDSTNDERDRMRVLEDEYLNWSLFHVKRDENKISVS